MPHELAQLWIALIGRLDPFRVVLAQGVDVLTDTREVIRPRCAALDQVRDLEQVVKALLLRPLAARRVPRRVVVPEARSLTPVHELEDRTVLPSRPPFSQSDMVSWASEVGVYRDVVETSVVRSGAARGYRRFALALPVDYGRCGTANAQPIRRY